MNTYKDQDVSCSRAGVEGTGGTQTFKISKSNKTFVFFNPDSNNT